MSRCSHITFDRFEEGEVLPALPAGTPELLQALMDDELGFREIAGLVQNFPSITARLLYLANSAWVGSLVPVTTVEGACSKLGLSVVRSVSVALTISSPFNSLRCPAFNVTKYWLAALLTADLAVRIARQLDEFPAEDLSVLQTAGILHNVGMLWLADRLPDLTSEALSAADADKDLTVSAALTLGCGAGYTEVGACLAESWQLPQILVDAIASHRQPDGATLSFAEIIRVATAYAAHEPPCDDATLPELLPGEREKLLSRERAEAFCAELPQWRNSTRQFISSFTAA